MKVLIAVDASENAEKALKFYVKNFHKPDNFVVILHVNDPPKIPTFSFTEAGSFPANEITKLMTEHNKKIGDLENQYTIMCKNEKIKSKISIRVQESGSPGETVIQAANEEGVELIVLGSRGLGTIRRTILGSVSDYVVHHAKMPALIVQ